MSENTISIVLSLIAVVISTVHIVFDKWLDNWWRKRDRIKAHEKFTQKVTRLQKHLHKSLNEANLQPEEQLKYLYTINDEFFEIIPFMLSSDYDIGTLKEAELKIDKFFLDMGTKLGAKQLHGKTN